MDAALRTLARPAKRAFLKKREKFRYILWRASDVASEGMRSFDPGLLARAAIRVNAAWRRQPAPQKLIYIPSPPIAKIRAILWHARHYGIRTFIETGTHHGHTTAAVSDMFDACVTIELSQHFHERACARFSGMHRITCLRGNSGSILVDVVRNLRAPAIFWLDAHHSGGDTADGGFDPMRAELSAIVNDRRFDHIVLIDDARIHSIDEVRRLAPRHVTTVRNDIIRLVPASTATP